MDSYSERLAATRAALRVRGVSAVIDNLTVHSKYSQQLTVTDIAKEIEGELRTANNACGEAQCSIWPVCTPATARSR